MLVFNIINEFKVIIPEIFLIISIFFLIIYGTVYSISKKYKNPIVTIENLHLVILTLVLYYFLVCNNNFTDITIFNNIITMSLFTIELKKILIFFLILTILISKDYLKYEYYNNFEISILLLILYFSFILILEANDFICLYLGMELQNFVFYIIMAYTRSNKNSLELTLRYFIIATLISILFLLSVAILYGLTGSFNFDVLKIYFLNLTELLIYINNNVLLLIIGSISLLIISLSFKLTIAPFHFWAIEIYKGISIFSMLLLMIFSKLMYFIIFVKIFYKYFDSIFIIFQNIFIILGLLSIIIGCLGGYNENNIRKIFVYSSINHMGFIMLGLSIGNFHGIYATFLYVLSYFFMIFGLFIVLFSGRNLKEDRYIEIITDLHDLPVINKLFSYFFAIMLFSFSGIPPLLGFWNKFILLISLVNIKLYTLCIIILLLNMISIFYYMKLIRIMFFDYLRKWNTTVILNYVNAYIYSLITLCVILFFIASNPILTYIYKLTILFYLS